MFCLQKPLHAFDAEFAAPTALFDATEWGLGGGRQAVIDADNSGFKVFSEPKHAAEVAGECVCAQTVWRIIGPLDRLGFGIKSTDWRNRCKSFLLHAQRAIWHICEHSRLKK